MSVLLGNLVTNCVLLWVFFLFIWGLLGCAARPAGGETQQPLVVQSTQVNPSGTHGEWVAWRANRLATGNLWSEKKA